MCVRLTPRRAKTAGQVRLRDCDKAWGKQLRNAASKTTAADSRCDVRRLMLQTLEHWQVAQGKPSRVCKRRRDIGLEEHGVLSEVAAHLNLASCHMECEAQAFSMVATSWVRSP